MKRLTFLFAAIVMLLTSCEGPAGRDGLDGKDGVGMNWEILYYTVNSNDWKLVGNPDDLNSYYMFEFNNESKITNFVYKKGVLTGYIVLNEGQNNEVLTPLPYVVPAGKMEGTNEHLWSEYYTFDYMPGSIAFYAYYTDFFTNNLPPTCKFRIVINW